MYPVVGSRSLLLATLFSSCIAAAAAAGPDLSRLSFHPVPLADAVAVPETAAVPAASDHATTPAPAPAPAAAGTATTAVAIRQYQGFISTTQAKEGPYALAVGEAALALGFLQQANGELEEAVASFERSMQVLRINHGLFSPDQVPVMQALVNIHLVRGDVASAHAMQEALFNLQTRHHGPATLAATDALIAWADWNVSMFLLQDRDSPSLFSADPELLRMRLRDPYLTLAYEHYTTALAVLQEQSTLADERLVTTERKLAALNFIFNRKVHDVVGSLPSYASQDRNFNSPARILEQADSVHFADGSSALRRAIDYSYNAPNPAYDSIAARMMELGDWYLLFDHRAAALDIYEDALEVMESARLPQDAVDRIMAPGMPVQTPDVSYLATPAGKAGYAGYIDVEFDLSRFGMASHPRIIGNSTDDKRIARELLHTIRNCKFRPKFIAGTPANDEKIRLRYYYAL